MTDDDAKKVGKCVLAIAKTIPSTLIGDELAKQEKFAQAENRLDDLLLIRLGQSIKKHVDFLLDEWIVNL